MSGDSLPPSVRALKNAGQQVWLDDLSRGLVRSGGLHRAIEEWGVTGVTSNPAIVARAVCGNPDYDASIGRCRGRGMDTEAIALELAVEDVAGAADLLRSTWVATDGGDGWVSIQLPPRLADDEVASVEAALALHERVGRPNVLIKMPATTAGLRAIEEVVVRGVPVTVTLLLTPAHAAQSAEAYVRAIERRAAARRSLDVRSYAALYVSRWDRDLPAAAPDLDGALGIAIADVAHGAVNRVFSDARWRRLEELGARPQTLLFASTGTSDAALGAAYYVERLSAAGTADTIPPVALEAFAATGQVRAPLTGRARAPTGVDVDARGEDLQRQAAARFAEAWEGLLADIAVRAGASG